MNNVSKMIKAKKRRHETRTDEIEHLLWHGIKPNPHPIWQREKFDRENSRRFWNMYKDGTWKRICPTNPNARFIRWY